MFEENVLSKIRNRFGGKMSNIASKIRGGGYGADAKSISQRNT